MSWRLIPGASLVPTPWRNGLGTSRDIVSVHEGDALLWQVGLAELERDAPFSHYPMMDRIFTPVAGDPPPELAFSGGPFEPCPLLAPRPFPGDVPTLSRIPSPGRAFNVIVARGRLAAAVHVLRPAAGTKVQPTGAEVTVVHCLSGTVASGLTRAGPGDTLVGAGPFTAAEASVVIRVAIRPVTPGRNTRPGGPRR